MKKLSVMLVAIALLVGTSAATAAANVEKEPKTTSEEITQLLENPGFIVEEEMLASVQFVINKDHEIVVLSVDTENDLLEGYIKDRLNYHKLEGSLKEGSSFTVPVRVIAAK